MKWAPGYYEKNTALLHEIAKQLMNENRGKYLKIETRFEGDQIVAKVTVSEEFEKDIMKEFYERFP